MPAHWVCSLILCATFLVVKSTNYAHLYIVSGPFLQCAFDYQSYMEVLFMRKRVRSLIKVSSHKSTSFYINKTCPQCCTHHCSSTHSHPADSLHYSCSRSCQWCWYTSAHNLQFWYCTHCYLHLNRTISVHIVSNLTRWPYQLTINKYDCKFTMNHIHDL